MDREKLIHDWLIETLKARLSRQYREIIDNPRAEGYELNGVYPDLILANHGMVLAAVEVETEQSISPESAERWKRIVQSGVKLTLMIPKQRTRDVTALLWEKGIADRVSIGTYDILINMP